MRTILWSASVASIVVTGACTDKSAVEVTPWLRLVQETRGLPMPHGAFSGAVEERAEVTLDGKTRIYAGTELRAMPLKSGKCVLLIGIGLVRTVCEDGRVLETGTLECAGAPTVVDDMGFWCEVVKVNDTGPPLIHITRYGLDGVPTLSTSAPIPVEVRSCIGYELIGVGEKDEVFVRPTVCDSDATPIVRINEQKASVVAVRDFDAARNRLKVPRKYVRVVIASSGR
jgi:hypothetical protein